MRRFLYFIPKLTGVNTGILSNRGLLDRFSDRGGSLIDMTSMPLNEGPGGSGCIFATGDQPPTYAPETQEWVECQNFWLAVEDIPPRPEDLLRPIYISGYQMLLGDENVWRVPVIHRWDPVTMYHVPNVPSMIKPVKGPTGKYVMQRGIHPKFAAVDELASRIFAIIGDNCEISMSQAFSDAAALLAVNYRLGPEEVGMLSLLNETTVLDVLKACIDSDAMHATAEALTGTGVRCAESSNITE